LILLSIYAFYSINQPQNINLPDKQLVVKSTDRGQKLKITLPDGSTVLLNALSELTYLEDFSDSLRWVELTGEAYFEVEKDANKPFIVKTADLATHVLGTSFNVRHRSVENQIQIALLSGSISINVPDENILLEPGDIAVFDCNKESLVKGKWDYKKDFGWKDGLLYFEQAKLEEIKEKIEMWYGVQIDVSNETDKSRHFTGSFRNESLRNVLESLSFTFDFSYQLKDKHVLIQF
jgi:transmembrane sensor